MALDRRWQGEGRAARVEGWVLVLIAGLCVGCSFAFVTGPPSESALEAESVPVCTTSVLHPVGDIVNAGIGGLNMGIAAVSDRRGGVSWYGVGMEPETAVALGTVQLALFGASAAYGFVQTSRCSEYLAEMETKGPSWSPALAADPSPGPRVPASTPTAVAPPPSARPAPAPAPAPTVPTATFPN